MSHRTYPTALTLAFVLALFCAVSPTSALADQVSASNCVTGTAQVSGVVCANTVWSSASGVIVVDGDVEVPSGVTLTIEAGAVVKFKSGGLRVSGALRIIGAVGKPATLTSFEDDTVGGDSDGVPQSEDPLQIGTWPIDVLPDASVDIIGADLRYMQRLMAGASSHPWEQPGAEHVLLVDSTVTGAGWGHDTTPAYAGGSLISIVGTQGSVTISGNHIRELPSSSVTDPNQTRRWGLVEVNYSRGDITIVDNTLISDSAFTSSLNQYFLSVTDSALPPAVEGNTLIGYAKEGIRISDSDVDLNSLVGNSITKAKDNGGLVLSRVRVVASGTVPTGGVLGVGIIVPDLADIIIPTGVTVTIEGGLVRGASVTTEGSGMIRARGTAIAPVLLEPSRYYWGQSSDDYELGTVSFSITDGGSLQFDHVVCSSCHEPRSDYRSGVISGEKAKSISVTNSHFGDLIGNVINIIYNQEDPVISGNIFDVAEGPYSYRFPVEITNSPVDIDALSGNMVTGSTPRNNAIYLQGVSLVRDGALPWDGNMTPLISSVDIPAGVALTLNPGTVVKVLDGFTVSGTIVSLGTEIDPVVFTAPWDNSVGGYLPWFDKDDYGGGGPFATYVTVNERAEGASFDHTVFMHADTAIYVREHTETYITNSKFVSNNKAVDAYNAVNRWADSSFESKYFQAAFGLLSAIVGKRTDCSPPYNEETVLMQGNWFGESGVAGVEMGSVPGITGVITLGDRNLSLGEILDSVRELFPITADRDEQPELYDQQKMARDEAEDDATETWNALSRFTSSMNGILLRPGTNSIPVTEWTCTVAGIPISLTSSPVRHLHLAVLDYVSEWTRLPTFPPGIENALLSFIGVNEWLDEEPFIESWEAPSDPRLSSLLFQGYDWIGSRYYPLTPAFTPEMTEYTVTVPYEVSRATLWPGSPDAVTSDPAQRDCNLQWWGACVPMYFIGDGWATLVSNEWGSLAIGDNVARITASTEDGAEKTYTVHVVREAPRADASLKELEFSAGDLFPVFDPDVTEYTLTLNQPISEEEVVNWAAATRDEYALVSEISGDGSGIVCSRDHTQPDDHCSRSVEASISYGVANVGSPGPHAFAIHVAAQDGTTTRTYVINVETPAPISIASVSVSGQVQVGQVLSAAASGVSPVGASVSYQWLRGGKEILGATGKTYKLTAADMCSVVSVRVSVSKSGFGSVSKVSSSVVGPVFSDVPVLHTFYTPICWAANTGVTAGSGGSTFSPANPVNRGSMAQFLYRLAGSPKWTPPATSPFVDVATSHQFYKAITWLYSQGITTGVTVGGKLYYEPSNAVNRGSMSAFLYRLAGRPSWSAPAVSPFTDVVKSHQFYSSITWLADRKITAGITVGGKFVYQPSNAVNRGSMSAFMQRLSKTQLQCTKYTNAIGC